jgi:hypothetical protein
VGQEKLCIDTIGWHFEVYVKTPLSLVVIEDPLVTETSGMAFVPSLGLNWTLAAHTGLNSEEQK